MKKFLMLWLPLILVVLGGLGVGLWFLNSDSSSETVVETVESTPEQKTLTVPAAYKVSNPVKHIAEYELQSAALTKLETAADSVLFVPSKSAIDTFVKDTALGFEKFLPYHVVIGEAAIAIEDGSKLKTEDGQELVVVKIENQLYIRDAKGNDAKLGNPIQAKNGKIYLIDRVLLTQ
jgi:uncharacterized surface protein with fasciclin (FAS1) repeats